MIRAGQRVFFKPEWQDPGDEEWVFYAVEDEFDGWLLIGTQTGMPIDPTQRQPVDRIERTEDMP